MNRILLILLIAFPFVFKPLALKPLYLPLKHSLAPLRDTVPNTIGPRQLFWLLSSSAAPCGDTTYAHNYKAALTSAGVTVTADMAATIDTLFADLQGCPNPRYATANVISKIQAMYPMLGGTAAGHAINARTPGTYTISWVNSPTHSSGGVDFNGTTQYGNTNYTASLIATNNIHLSYYSRDNTKIREQPMDIGVYDGFGTLWGYKVVAVMGGTGSNLNNAYAWLGTQGNPGVGALYATGPFSAACMVVANRSSATYSSMIRNGTLIASSTTAAAAGALSSPGTQMISIGGNGTTSTMSDRQCAWASIGTAFTDSESITVSTIVNEFQKRRSRNVY
jgi:hypothetical protein